MNFAEKLTTEMNRKGISQSKLAKSINVYQSMISDMAAGKRRPYMDQAFKIARTLGVPLDYLADDEMEEPPLAPGELPQDQRTVLALYTALKLPLDEAIRRLAGPEAAMPDPDAAKNDRQKTG